MLLKEDIIKTITEMHVSELLMLENMIQNIKKARLRKIVLQKQNTGAVKVRSALKNIQLSNDIQALREERY